MLVHGYDFPVKPGSITWLKMLQTASAAFEAQKIAAMANAEDDIEALQMLAAAADEFLCATLGDDYAQLAGVDTDDIMELSDCINQLHEAVNAAETKMRAAGAKVGRGGKVVTSPAPAAEAEPVSDFGRMNRAQRRAYIKMLAAKK